MTTTSTGEGGSTTATTTTSAGAGETTPSAASTTTTTDPKGGQGATTTSQSFDPEKDLTPEQWKAIYGSGRFKQLNERAARAAELEKAQKDAADAALADQGKFKELAESKDQELTLMQTAVVNAEIKAEAARLGAVNPAIVAQAIDRANVQFDKGNVTGVAEAVEALKASDPYLFNNQGNNQTPRIGSPTNPGSNNTGMKFKMSEIRNPKFYREHATEIKQAIANGQVDKDS